MLGLIVWWTTSFANAAIVAYVTNDPLLGLLGDRQTSSATCLAYGEPDFGCSVASSYLYYFGSTPYDLPGVSNDTIVISHDDEILGNLTSFDTSGFPSFWIGSSTDVRGNCAEWQADGCRNGLARTTEGTRYKRCDVPRYMLCLCVGGITKDTPAPSTLTPTTDPTTTRPTRDPTAYPTLAPSRSPTDSPSESPTKTPTKTPSESPTHLPTLVPTAIPTTLPTIAPTRVPTSYVFLSFLTKPWSYRVSRWYSLSSSQEESSSPSVWVWVSVWVYVR